MDTFYGKSSKELIIENDDEVIYLFYAGQSGKILLEEVTSMMKLISEG